jgi:hypothetical protein
MNDDELVTEQDRRAVAVSRDYFRQNPEGGMPFEQVVAECGFTLDQVRHQQDVVSVSSAAPLLPRRNGN